jgi:Winged helix-turn-helix domain (DUF2582)
LNPEQIGRAAGAIWNCLEQERGVLSMAKVKEKTGLDTEALCLGLGWLAREGKVLLEKRGRSVRITLAEVAAV